MEDALASVAANFIVKVSERMLGLRYVLLKSIHLFLIQHIPDSSCCEPNKGKQYLQQYLFESLAEKNVLKFAGSMSCALIIQLMFTGAITPKRYRRNLFASVWFGNVVLVGVNSFFPLLPWKH